ncbi:MAG: hypothetical protein C6I01_05815 [Epsilonproteobacteria bacterium]|nr:hypothetical protein [Campylobacterota bacterium]NPA89105.1 hypothetical protein [Campylobacterota bacterium]
MRKYLVPLVSGGIILVAFLIFLVRDSLFSQQKQIEEEQKQQQAREELRVKCLNKLSQLNHQLVALPLTRIEEFYATAQKELKGCQQLVPQEYGKFNGAVLKELGKFQQLRERCNRQLGLFQQEIESTTSMETLDSLREKVVNFLEGECGDVVDGSGILKTISARQKKLEQCLTEIGLLKEELKGVESIEEVDEVKKELKGVSKRCSLLSPQLDSIYQLVKQKEKLYKRKIAKEGEKSRWCRERLALWKGEATGATSLSLLRVVKSRIIQLGKKCPDLDISSALDIIAQREGELKLKNQQQQEKLESCKSQLEVIKEGLKGSQSIEEVDNYLQQGQQVIKECPSLLSSYRALFKLGLRKKNEIRTKASRQEAKECQLKLATFKTLIKTANSKEALQQIIFKLQGLNCPDFAGQIDKLLKEAHKKIEELEQLYLQCDKKYQELELRFQRAKGFFHSDREAIAQIKGEAMELRDKGTCRQSTLRELNNLIEKCNDEL